jgi:hypothetical protein
MTNHDYMNLMTQWVRADHDPTFVAAPFTNDLPHANAVHSLRCCFAENAPNHLQFWVLMGEVDAAGVDLLVDLMEINDEIDEQAEGLGYFACLSEETRERFAWGFRVPFTPASTVNDLRQTAARGQAHAAARWQAALPR